MRLISQEHGKPSMAKFVAVVALNLIIAPFNIYETLHNPGESPVWVIASFGAGLLMIWALGVMVRDRYLKAPTRVGLQGLVPTP